MNSSNDNCDCAFFLMGKGFKGTHHQRGDDVWQMSTQNFLTLSDIRKMQLFKATVRCCYTALKTVKITQTGYATCWVGWVCVCVCVRGVRGPYSPPLLVKVREQHKFADVICFNKRELGRKYSMWPGLSTHRCLPQRAEYSHIVRNKMVPFQDWRALSQLRTSYRGTGNTGPLWHLLVDAHLLKLEV